MRTKPKNTITTRVLAEGGMARVDAIDRSLAALDLEEAEKIHGVRETFSRKRKEANCVGLEAERALLIKELEQWAEIDSQTWDKKTMETPFGKLGFRVSQPTVVLVKKVAKSFKAALELLQARLPKFVRTAPEIDKEAILSAERAEGDDFDAKGLRECGLEIKQDDEFWVESNAAKDLDDASRRLKACA